MLKKTKGCAFGVVFGTLFKAIVKIIDVLFRVIAKVLVFLGLWIPLVYALFGFVLYLFFDFNPFDLSVYSTLYLSGALACIFCSLIIGIRNLLIRPTQSFFEGFRHPLWEKDREEKMKLEEEEIKKSLTKRERKKLSPPEPDEIKTYKSRPINMDFLPPKQKKHRHIKQIADFAAAPAYETSRYNENLYNHNPPPDTVITVERPRVYFSRLEPDLLIHEYNNRFEVYRIVNNNSVLDRIEYK